VVTPSIIENVLGISGSGATGQVAYFAEPTRIRVREVGAGAGRGRLLTLLGSTLYGGADGAIAPLEKRASAFPRFQAGVSEPHLIYGRLCGKVQRAAEAECLV
jgi:hypothetical protein